MQGILEALQNNDYITSITPIMEDSKEIGYTIYFKKGNPITIYHGQDGQNGQDGKPGEDGQNGQDGYTPQIGVKQDIDGIYYWTLDGEWMTDENGNKIKAQGIDGQNGQDGTPGEDGQDGQDGITPKFKIEDKYWWVSYNNGANWEKLGQATGEDATSIFKEVTQDEDFIHFKMQDDTVISVPKHHPLSISFSETEDIRVLPNKTYTINYTITGSDENTVIKALAQDGFRAVENGDHDMVQGQRDGQGEDFACSFPRLFQSVQRVPVLAGFHIEEDQGEKTGGKLSGQSAGGGQGCGGDDLFFLCHPVAEK